MKKLFYAIIVLAFLGIVVDLIGMYKCYQIMHGYNVTTTDSFVIHKSDTIVKRDTSYFPVPTLYYIKSDKSKIAIVVDTIDEIEDTVSFDQKVYRDSTYTAWVSGFCCKLDSIQVYSEDFLFHDTVYINKVQKIVSKSKRWHFGPSVGVSVAPGGKIEPTLGLSISYGIFSW